MHPDSPMTRRQFLDASKSATLMSLVALVAGCNDTWRNSAAFGGTGGTPSGSIVGGTTGTGTTSGWKAIAQASSLSSTPQHIQLPGGNSGVFATLSNNQPLVLSDVCTHQGCTVALAGSEFDCPCHGSRFALSGQVIQGPAAQPLATYQAMVQNGTLYIQQG